MSVNFIVFPNIFRWMMDDDSKLLFQGLQNFVRQKNGLNLADEAFGVDADFDNSSYQKMNLNALLFNKDTLNVTIEQQEGKNERNITLTFDERDRKEAKISWEKAQGGTVIFVKTLTGKVFKYSVNPSACSLAALRYGIFEKQGTPEDQQRLIYAGRHMEVGRMLCDYGVRNECTLHLVLRLRGGGCSIYVLDPALFEPNFNFDFRNLKDDGKCFERGGLPYRRPIGAMRYAIKVRGLFENDQWLGEAGNRLRSSQGEWAVAYHGTTDPRAVEIVKRGGLKLDKGTRFAFGKGIYCTPDPKTAVAYAAPYEFRGRKFRLIMQACISRLDFIETVRVNRSSTKVVTKAEHGVSGLDDYWVVDSDENIRAYGICVFPSA